LLRWATLIIFYGEKVGGKWDKKIDLIVIRKDRVCLFFANSAVVWFFSRENKYILECRAIR
jgi:hypothetical protein